MTDDMEHVKDREGLCFTFDPLARSTLTRVVDLMSAFQGILEFELGAGFIQEGKVSEANSILEKITEIKKTAEERIDFLANAEDEP